MFLTSCFVRMRCLSIDAHVRISCLRRKTTASTGDLTLYLLLTGHGKDVLLHVSEQFDSVFSYGISIDFNPQTLELQANKYGGSEKQSGLEPFVDYFEKQPGLRTSCLLI